MIWLWVSLPFPAKPTTPKMNSASEAYWGWFFYSSLTAPWISMSQHLPLHHRFDSFLTSNGLVIVLSSQRYVSGENHQQQHRFCSFGKASYIHQTSPNKSNVEPPTNANVTASIAVHIIHSCWTQASEASTAALIRSWK